MVGDHPPTFLQSLLVCHVSVYLFWATIYRFKAGGLAGTSVDLLFFPIDTLKTRLQSAQGFARAGGFVGVYKGIGSVVVGSAPGGEDYDACIIAIFKQEQPRYFFRRMTR